MLADIVITMKSQNPEMLLVEVEQAIKNRKPRPSLYYDLFILDGSFFCEPSEPAHPIPGFFLARFKAKTLDAGFSGREWSLLARKIHKYLKAQK